VTHFVHQQLLALINVKNMQIASQFDDFIPKAYEK
jgi:hypothetical protein